MVVVEPVVCRFRISYRYVCAISLGSPTLGPTRSVFANLLNIASRWASGPAPTTYS
jgi:hypothetical protein